MKGRIQIWFLLSLVCGLVVLFLTTWPYVAAYRSAGADYVFGGFLLNYQDGNSYLAKMYQGWLGEWRFHLPYTAEAGGGAYLFLFYLLLGHAARIFNLSLIFTFQAARFAGSLVLLFSLYHFFKRLLPEPGRHTLAFILAALGSGMGWLALPFGAVTADYWVAEAYPFLSAYTHPHFSLGLALLLWLLLPPQVDGSPRFRWRFPLYLLGSSLLGIMSPFGIVVVLMVLSGLLVWELWMAKDWHANDSITRRLSIILEVLRQHWAFWRVILVTLGGVPWLLYDLWVTHSDAILAGWNAQNITPTPPLWDLILSLSPLLLLAIPGAIAAVRGKKKSLYLLVVWAGIGLALLFLPFGLQRRFMMGIFVPLAGLAVPGLETLAAGSRRKTVFGAALVLLFVLPTNATILLAARHGIQTHAPELYLSRDEANAFSWIKSNTPQNAIILAAARTGLLIPAHTGRKVIYGHPFETVNADQEIQLVESFFKSLSVMESGKEPEDFISSRGVGYLFIGPSERALGGAPIDLNMDPLYSSGQVTVYRVDPYK
ncbi:MAG: hypothetical protein P8074_00380 [Anaerolineales bacterium]